LFFCVDEEIDDLDHLLFYREDLPHKLTLPSAVLGAKTSLELKAIAMLGQGRICTLVLKFSSNYLFDI